jgi:hypothetical protein
MKRFAKIPDCAESIKHFPIRLPLRAYPNLMVCIVPDACDTKLSWTAPNSASADCAEMISIRTSLSSEYAEAGELLAEEVWHDAGGLCHRCRENRARLVMMYCHEYYR